MLSTIVHAADPVLLADISDPTSGGLLTKVITFVVGAAAILAIPSYIWTLFKAFHGADTDKGAVKWDTVRSYTVYFLVFEGICAAVITLANLGSGLAGQVGL